MESVNHVLKIACVVTPQQTALAVYTDMGLLMEAVLNASMLAVFSATAILAFAQLVFNLTLYSM